MDPIQYIRSLEKYMTDCIVKHMCLWLTDLRKSQTTLSNEDVRQFVLLSIDKLDWVVDGKSNLPTVPTPVGLAEKIVAYLPTSSGKKSQKDLIDSVRKSFDLLKKILVVFKVRGILDKFKDKILYRTDVLQFVLRYTLLYLVTAGEKFAKSQLCYFLPYRVDRARLPAPEQVSFGTQRHLGTGLLKVLAKGLLTRGKNPNILSTSLASKWYFATWDLCHGVKKGLELPSDDFVDQAIQKHKKITQERTPVEFVFEEFSDVYEWAKVDLDLRGEVSRTVHEVLGHFRKTVDFQIPSASSHFESSRAMGGAFGALMELTHSSLPDVELHIFDNGASVEDLEFEQLLMPSIDETQKRAQSFYDECVKLTEDFLKSEQPIKTKVVGLKEPLKCRPITLGEHAPYYVAIYLQKLVHGILRRHPTFQLIGKPVSVDIIQAVFPEYREGYSYVSGDYTAATDNLNPELSEHCAREICLHLGLEPFWWQLFTTCLTNHELHYGDGYVGQQKWGQLMGSPVSFPVLCIINAAVTRASVELAEQRRTGSNVRKRVSLKNLPLLINGDDVAFMEKEQDLDIWSKLVTRAGLEPSVGKNYVSEHLLIINSRHFTPFKNYGDTVTWNYDPFINFGLLYPINYPKGVDMVHGSKSLKSIGSCSQDLVDGFSPLYRDRLMKEFMQNWSEHLASLESIELNYYLPKALGGLGLAIWSLSLIHI